MRLQREANLLAAHPEGLTQAQIAKKMQVHRSTILRDLPDLGKISPIYEEDGRLFLDRTADLIHLNLNLDEALAVHLAARLLATRMDRQNPNAAGAMRKLAEALETLAPQISRHVLQSADLLDEARRRQDPRYLQVLQQLTAAWAEQRQARVWHHSERTGKVSEYRFHPYFIEPYAIGQTTMLIGYSDPPGKLRTLKIERIERVELLNEPYEIPVGFDPQALLADAWGIWYTESEPVDVVLRFDRSVAGRVRETRWHRSERVEEQEDGSLIWRARVAEPKEMLYWIRGWGSQCEVLEPKNLRDFCCEEAQRLQQIYSVYD
jgi:predicted DNA-binding transcriptional regulator YafY